MKFREWVSLVLALLGAVIGTLSFITSRMTAGVSRRLEADQLLDQAWDHMVGSKAGRYASKFVDDPHELELARRDIARAKMLDPKYPKAYWTEATLAFAERRYDDSVSLNRQAIALDAKASTPHNKIGFVYVEQRKWREAESEFREAIRLDPTDSSPYSNLCFVLLQQARIGEAERACAEALRLYPAYEVAQQNMEAVQMAKLQPSLAIRGHATRGN